MRDLRFYLGIDPLGALAITVATILLYFVLVLVLERWGQRLFSSPSSVELAVVTVIGAIIGRSILGEEPTLAGGLLALTTLFLLQTVSGRVRRTTRVRSRSRHRAVAIMVAGHLDLEEMSRRHLSEVDLWVVLRRAGIRAPGEVALVVLEKNGTFSVIRAGDPVHPAVLTGVLQAEEVLARVQAMP